MHELGNLILANTVNFGFKNLNFEFALKHAKYDSNDFEMSISSKKNLLMAQ